MLKIHDFFSRNRWKKKVVRNFLTNLKILFFFEFFSENVFKTLLRGRETTRKKYRIVYEKFLKYVIFFDFGCPSPITTHPSIYSQGDKILKWTPYGYCKLTPFGWWKINICILQMSTSYLITTININIMLFLWYFSFNHTM